MKRRSGRGRSVGRESTVDSARRMAIQSPNHLVRFLVSPPLVTGTTTQGVTCTALGTVTVDECVDLDFQAVSDQQETDPGGFLCLNDDDDNGNGVPDKDEPGPTAGENDLKALTVSIDPALTGTVTLSAIAGATKIKLYENADRSNPVTLPKVWTVPG